MPLTSSSLTVQPLKVQTIVAEIPSLLGIYSSIPFRCTSRLALATCHRELSFWVSYPKPVPESRHGFIDYGEDVQLLSALRAWPSGSCFDDLGNVAQTESDVYLVLRAAMRNGGLHNLWSDYSTPQPDDDGPGPCPISDTDFVIMFPHIGNEEGGSAGGQPDRQLMSALASKCKLPQAEQLVSIIFEEHLKRNELFPRPLHFAVLHNSAAAVQMILSYLKQDPDFGGYALRDALQYPLDKFYEMSPLFFGILFADCEVTSALKRAGSHLNALDYETACELQGRALLEPICDRMVELGLATDMFVLRQYVLRSNKCRISWNDRLWSRRARTDVTSTEYAEPFEEAQRLDCEGLRA